MECLPSSRIRPLLLSVAATAAARSLPPLSALTPLLGPTDSAPRLAGLGGKEGALTPFFRASIHRGEKMPVPPGIPVVLVLPLPSRIFRPFSVSPFPPVSPSRRPPRRFLPLLSLSFSSYPDLFLLFFRLSLSFSRSRVTRTMGPFWHGSYRCYALVGPPGGPPSDATESHEDCRGRTIAPE